MKRLDSWREPFLRRSGNEFKLKEMGHISSVGRFVERAKKFQRAPCLINCDYLKSAPPFWQRINV